VQSTATYPGNPTQQWIVHLEERQDNRSTGRAVFHHLAQKVPAHSTRKTYWLLENWDSFSKRLQIIIRRSLAGVDWITKKMVTGSIRRVRRMSWEIPWLQSVDLEYHNIDPLRGCSLL